ncbi:SPFH domain-containing protein [Isoptericola sp. b441]|uniref:SPFH domain-containing protein n=1 Tax=Actinotalea lenta TaxID=3064654 RepID=A0ABT9D4L2_9CELL|nr:MULTISPECIES: SPFH domain-containing protein [unclassified Isoptericola]MDO8105586.1 SPFH domain-containing protein [Isoptericola sp. b441]MDO8122706.1 SPFH domain-containing protein [Isoptericola sp. b490]
MSVVERDTQPARPVGRDGTVVEIGERRAWQAEGFAGLVLGLVLTGAAVWLFALAGSPDTTGSDLWAVAGIVASLLAVVQWTSLSVVQPGRTKVVQFFGRYVGTVRRTGLVWTVPLSTRRSVSVRVRNFETARMKVNDATGNPVEIAAIVVWQVADTAKATFAVEEYDEFVETQSEAAVRHVAGTYPYDAGEGEESLRGSTDQVSAELAEEVAARVAVAGVEIVETRISHLAYAPEIAQAMLQRQQANAVVAARSRIVEGAVGMVQMALDELAEAGVVELDEERKAAMVSNLLVVLCGDSRATPVVNTGTLYQ